MLQDEINKTIGCKKWFFGKKIAIKAESVFVLIGKSYFVYK